MSEKQFENKIKAFLKQLPNTWFFKHWGGGLAPAGIPDIIACINGRFVGIEVKAENGRPSPLQLDKIAEINASGGYGVIVKPSRWNALQADLIAISRGEPCVRVQ